jgi:hypothetical protein
LIIAVEGNSSTGKDYNFPFFGGKGNNRVAPCRPARRWVGHLEEIENVEKIEISNINLPTFRFTAYYIQT